MPRRMAWRVRMPKKTSTRFSQEPEVGGEVQGDPRVVGQPGGHRRVFVGGVVVDHHVQLAPRVGLGDLLEEPQELLVAVPVVAGVDHLAGGDLERGGWRGHGFGVSTLSGEAAWVIVRTALWLAPSSARFTGDSFPTGSSGTGHHLKSSCPPWPRLDTAEVRFDAFRRLAQRPAAFLRLEALVAAGRERSTDSALAGTAPSSGQSDACSALINGRLSSSAILVAICGTESPRRSAAARV